MAVDLFELRRLLRHTEQLKMAKRFLVNMFFGETDRSTTRHIDVDVRKGKRRVAPYVSSLLPGKVVDRVGFETKTITPPYIKIKDVLDPKKLFIREPGQTLHVQGNLTPAEQAAQYVGGVMADFNDMIDRREEEQAAQALTTGIVVATGDGVDITVDFQMPAANKVVLSGTNLWSDTVNSKPLQDLRNWSRQVLKSSGFRPDVLILGEDVVDAFIEHPDVKDQLNTRRIDLGEIMPEVLPDNARYIGRINEVGLDIYAYDEWYLDDNDVEQPMIPANKIIMGSTQARCIRHYGVIEDVEYGDFAVSRFAKSWVQKDPSARFFMMQSAPLMNLHQVDAFLNAQVLA